MAVDDVWVGEWTGPAVLRIRAGRVAVLRPDRDADGAAVARVGGVVLPGFCDSHVHLGLVDAGALVGGGIARVVDLGWDPAAVAGWADGAAGSRLPGVSFAGAFLTAVGGYPSGRSWAPDAAVRQLRDVAEARAGVAEMHGHGARFAKLVLHAGSAEDGGGLSDEIAHAVVDEAHRLGLVVVAHAEGAGQAARAERLGVDRLAHTPWTERLGDELITSMALRMTWVSTLDIHGWGDRTPELAVALDNLARFAAAGGRVLYGTDLGNGPLPTALNRRELDALVAAGVTPAQLLDALAPLPAREVAQSRLAGAPEPTSRDLAVGGVTNGPREVAQSCLAGAPEPTSRDLAVGGVTNGPREVARSVAQSAAGETSRRPARAARDAIELGERVSWVPTRAPTAVADLTAWLLTARVVAAADLEETHT